MLRLVKNKSNPNKKNDKRIVVEHFSLTRKEVEEAEREMRGKMLESPLEPFPFFLAQPFNKYEGQYIIKEGKVKKTKSEVTKSNPHQSSDHVTHHDNTSEDGHPSSRSRTPSLKSIDRMSMFIFNTYNYLHN